MATSAKLKAVRKNWNKLVYLYSDSCWIALFWALQHVSSARSIVYLIPYTWHTICIRFICIMNHDGPQHAIGGRIQKSERCLFIRDSMPIDGGWFRYPVGVLSPWSIVSLLLCIDHSEYTLCNFSKWLPVLNWRLYVKDEINLFISSQVAVELHWFGLFGMYRLWDSLSHSYQIPNIQVCIR